MNLTTKATGYTAELAERRKTLEALLTQQEPMEAILAKLPIGLPVGLHASRGCIQISSASHEQCLSVMRVLSAGKWTRTPCHADSTKIDYETEINGIVVILYDSTPPASCRIEEWTEEVPAQKIVHRKVVCA